MNTPIYDFLIRYTEQNPLRMHMPGHKGRGPGGVLDPAYALDITEIPGADSLFDAAGIIAESEANAAALYHTAGTFYSTAGSTLCIQAMLTLMGQENRRVLAVRNVHRAFLTACVLLGLEVEWIFPSYTGGILSGTVTPAQIAAALDASPAPACVYVTSPDYLGHCADIGAIAAVCRQHDAPLLVDNAHGAHLGLFTPSRHPIALGADLCCDSAHKLLPALTGCAYLHTARPRYAQRAKAAMSLFGSTSPSYLQLASLDLCNAYLAEHGAADLARVTASLSMLRQELADCWTFYPGEPLHLTLCAAASGMDGRELDKRLREEQIFCEYADRDFVVLLSSCCTTEEELSRLRDALRRIALYRGQPAQPEPFSLPVPEQVCSMRQATLGDYETLNVEDAEGRICAGIHVPCPPAIPIAVSGERISRECINIFRRYGIPTVNVVK